MNFLERSYTTYSRRGRGSRQDNTAIDLFGTDHETMEARRKLMGKRPNTSAGISEDRKHTLSKGPSRPRDDVKSPTCSEDLHKAGRMLEITDGLDTFRFPTPSPRMPPRSATFQHSPSPLQYESPRIGVAIGSPSHAPPNWGRAYTADNIATVARNQPPSRPPPRPPQQAATFNQSAQEQRKKKTSWKPFGGLFRKTSKLVPEESRVQGKHLPGESESQRCSPDLSQLLPSSGLASPVMTSPRPTSPWKHSRTPSWSRIHSRAGSRDQSEKTPHVPAKLVRKRSISSPRTTTQPVGISNSPRGHRRDSPMEHENTNIELLQKPTANTPKLLLEFPTPEFERYSVMFGSLLSKHSGPSLLERRQSKLQRKRSGQGNAGESLGIVTPAGVPQRTLSSPHLTTRMSIRVDSKSPAQSPKHSRSPSQRRPQPLQRSNTVPILATSPLQSTYMRDRMETLDSSEDSPHSALYSEDSLAPTPTTVTTCADTESIKRLLEQNEPAWQMVTSNPVSILTPTTEKSSLYPKVKSREDLERQIVQVSVARQVSVSRARTRVQKAMETKQPLRPRVVELTKNRKSTVGVLVSAGDEAEEPMPERKLGEAS